MTGWVREIRLIRVGFPIIQFPSSYPLPTRKARSSKKSGLFGNASQSYLTSRTHSTDTTGTDVTAAYGVAVAPSH